MILVKQLSSPAPVYIYWLNTDILYTDIEILLLHFECTVAIIVGSNATRSIIPWRNSTNSSRKRLTSFIKTHYKLQIETALNDALFPLTGYVECNVKQYKLNNKKAPNRDQNTLLDTVNRPKFKWLFWKSFYVTFYAFFTNFYFYLNILKVYSIRKILIRGYKGKFNTF